MISAPRASGRLALDRGRISRHHDDCLHPQRSRRIGNALGVIAAGIGDDAALALVLGEGSDLVVSAAQLECADGLQVFGLEKELAAVFELGRFVDVRRNQPGAHGDAAQTRLRFANVVESDDGTVSIVILSAGQTSLREVCMESKMIPMPYMRSWLLPSQSTARMTALRKLAF